MMDDLISRQDAIDSLEKGLSKIPYMNNTDEDMIRRDERIGCIQEIRELTSVQPKERCIVNITLNEEDVERIVKEQVEEIKDSLPRKGKWERRIVDSGYNADWICSECGHRVKTDFVNYNFCPNCGCRMEEGDSDG